MTTKTGSWIAENRFAATLLVLLAASGPGLAMPIPDDLVIRGNIEYDTDFSFVDNATAAGAISARSGGSLTNIAYANGSIFGGTNPVERVLTEIGDGFGFTGTALTGDVGLGDAEFLVAIDTFLDLNNQSTTDTWSVRVRTDYLNSVDSAGPDAYADSEFVLSIFPTPGDVFLTSLYSDTTGGNEISRQPVAGLGGPLLDSGSFFYDIVLQPGDFFTVDNDWFAEGAAFDDADSMAALPNVSIFTTIDGVFNLTRPVPEPPALLLFLFGLAGLMLIRSRRASALAGHRI